MKKTLILAAIAAGAISSQANAAALCTGAAGGATVTFTTTANMFVKTNFNVKCSNNVFSNYSENGTAIGVVAGSGKGKNYFGGGTNSGQVKALGTCATTGCSATEISDTNSATQRDSS